MKTIVLSQFRELLSNYSDLHIVSLGSVEQIYGRICKRAIYGGVILNLDYSIKIILPADYPKNCPKVYSLNNTVPSKFHMFEDGSLCLGAPYEIEKKFRSNPSLLFFVDNLVIPFLYACEYKKKYKVMPYGERSHGTAGILESYQEIFGVKSVNKIILFLEIIAGQNYRGHWLCPCNSGKKVRDCHRKVIQEMMLDTEFYDFSRDIIILKLALHI